MCLEEKVLTYSSGVLPSSGDPRDHEQKLRLAATKVLTMHVAKKLYKQTAHINEPRQDTRKVLPGRATRQRVQAGSVKQNRTATHKNNEKNKVKNVVAGRESPPKK